MNTYKVLKPFRWGDFQLETGQILTVEPQGAILCKVCKKHGAEDEFQIVHKNAVKTMLELNTIEEY